MDNPFVYVQLHTTEPDLAREFYRGLFRWEYEDTPTDTDRYTEIIVGEGTSGGIMRSRVGEPSPHWLPFIRVEDIQSVTARACALGATVTLGPVEVPGKGWISMLADPAGARFGMVQPPD